MSPWLPCLRVQLEEPVVLDVFSGWQERLPDGQRGGCTRACSQGAHTAEVTPIVMTSPGFASRGSSSQQCCSPSRCSHTLRTCPAHVEEDGEAITCRIGSVLSLMTRACYPGPSECTNQIFPEADSRPPVDRGSGAYRKMEPDRALIRRTRPQSRARVAPAIGRVAVPEQLGDTTSWRIRPRVTGWEPRTQSHRYLAGRAAGVLADLVATGFV